MSMPDSKDQPLPTVYAGYHAYLLRLWQETPDDGWRASVQDAASGERRAFASLQELYAFLCRLAGEDSSS